MIGGQKSAAETVAASIKQHFVDSGRIRSGEKLPRVRELAARYSVSPGTVSSALSILASQGVVRKRQGSGCFVAEATAGTRPSVGSPLLGLVLPSATSTEIMMRICSGVERAARSAGWHTVVSITDWDYEREREEAGRLVASGVRGIVLYPVPRHRSQLDLDYLNSEFQDVPIVLVDMAFPEQNRPQVLFDNVVAGRRMTEWLLSRGHRNIAFMTVNTPEEDLLQRSNGDRLRGCAEALRNVGLPPDSRDIWRVTWQHARRREEIGKLLDAWLSSPNRSSAVIALEDYTAVLLIQEARVRGIAVPGDLSVVGFDDLSFGQAVHPPFPSTNPDFAEAGGRAAEIILATAPGTMPAPEVCVLDVPVCRTGVLPDAMARDTVPLRRGLLLNDGRSPKP